MARRNRHDNLLLKQVAGIQPAILDHLTGHDKIQIRLIDQFPLPVRGLVDLTNPDLWVGFAEAGNQINIQRRIGDGKTHPLLMAGRLHRVDPIVQGGKHLLDIGEENFPIFIQFHVAAHPVKEVHPQLLLQATNPRTDSRRAHMQPFSGFLYVLTACRFPKVFQMK